MPHQDLSEQTNPIPTLPLLHEHTFVGVSDLPGEAGRLVTWELSGPIEFAELAALWAAAELNLELLPERISPSTALRHALKEIAVNKYVAFPDPRGGWVLVEASAADGRAMGRRGRRKIVSTPGETQPGETEGQEGPGKAPEEKLEADPAEPVAASTVPPALPQETALVNPLAFKAVLTAVLEDRAGVVTLAIQCLSPTMTQELQQAWQRNLLCLTPVEVAAWLPTLVRHLDGIAYRAKGGIYYVPPQGRDTWRRFGNVVKAVSAHKIHAIPVLRAADTTAALLDAMEREATAFEEATWETLHTMKARARATVNGKAVEMLQKLQRYEALLGEGRLASIQKRLQELQTTLALGAVLGMNESSGTER